MEGCFQAGILWWGLIKKKTFDMAGVSLKKSLKTAQEEIVFDAVFTTEF